MVSTACSQKVKPVAQQTTTETYLFNDKRLGVKAINRLLESIERLNRDKKSADAEKRIWRDKARLLDSLRADVEAKLAQAQEALEQEKAARATLEKCISDLESLLKAADDLYKSLEDRFNQALAENARIQDSLRHEIALRDRLLFKIAEEDFRNGLQVVLMKKNKKGVMVPVNAAYPAKADRDDVDAIWIHYDFSVSKVLALPRQSLMSVEIPRLNYLRKGLTVTGILKQDFVQYKGCVKILTGDKGLNLHKTGILAFNINIFNGETLIQTVTNGLKMALSN